MMAIAAERVDGDALYIGEGRRSSPVALKAAAVFSNIQEELVSLFALQFSLDKSNALASQLCFIGGESLQNISRERYLEIGRAYVIAAALFHKVVLATTKIPAGWEAQLKEHPVWKDEALICPFTEKVIRYPVYVVNETFHEITILGQYCEKAKLEEFYRKSPLTKRLTFVVDRGKEELIIDSLKQRQIEHLKTIQEEAFFSEKLLSLLLEESLGRRKSLVTSGVRVLSLALHYFQFMSEGGSSITDCKKNIRGKYYFPEAVSFDQNYFDLVASGMDPTSAVNLILTNGSEEQDLLEEL